MRYLLLAFLVSCATNQNLKSKDLPTHLDIKVINGLAICIQHYPPEGCATLEELNGHFVVDPETMEYLLSIKTLEGTNDDKDNSEAKTK